MYNLTTARHELTDRRRLELRVEALEKRVDEKMARSQVADETSPNKKSRSAAGKAVPNTPARPTKRIVAPPSSVRRVMNWVWGARCAATSA